MKILLFDPYALKFTRDMKDWWELQGHEVKFQQYYNPTLIEWADLIWFDTCDNNLKSAMNPSDSLQAEWLKDGIIESDMHKMDLTGKKIIVRPIDIEVWSGHHADEKLWDLVNDCIFLAPHIRDIMMADSRPQQSNMNVHVIPHSVNLNKWIFRDRQHGFNIAVVAEVWESKGIDNVLQIAYKLKQIDPRYHIYYVGKNQDYHWHQFYRKEFIEHNQLPITFLEWVDNLDEWLEDKNYLLHSSIKEAVSAATAEAAAKGIKPVLHAFGGYEPLWGDSGWVWQGIDEAISMITNSDYNSQSYRDYLIKKEYTTDQMMQRIQAIIES